MGRDASDAEDPPPRDDRRPEERSAAVDRARARIVGLHPTLTLLLVVGLVYLGQTVAGAALDGSVRRATTVLFVQYPAVAWPLSPLLHDDGTHLAANAFMLAITGFEAQRHLSGRQYAGLVLGAGVASTGLGVATRLPFADGPIGVVFAFATYLLVHLHRAHVAPSTDGGPSPELRQSPLRIAAVVLGLSVVLLVVLDVGQAALGGFEGINGGHLGGAVVGVSAAVLQRRRTAAACDRPEESEATA